MWQEERYQRIRLLLSKMQRVSTDRIMADLNVSRETVRRDLVDLEALGELKRVHGGAVQVGDEAPIAERAQTHVKAKLAIARAAARLVAGRRRCSSMRARPRRCWPRNWRSCRASRSSRTRSTSR